MCPPAHDKIRVTADNYINLFISYFDCIVRLNDFLAPLHDMSCRYFISQISLNLTPFCSTIS